MRKVNVPVDMSSEQKSILGVVSMRQLIYVVVSALILYGYEPVLYNAMGSLPFVAKLIICVITGLPIVLISLPLAFLTKKNYHMFLDHYLLIKFRSKAQRGNWRNGTKTKRWMEEL